MEQPLVTVFTSAVYPDATRIWYACVRRAFPADEARIEIFDDSSDGSLRPDQFPGATIRRQGPGRRDFEESYNDVLRRVDTPYLAFIDSDVYWTSRSLWARVKQALDQPDLAAFSLVSKHRKASHATSAVVLKVDLYRKVLEHLPSGFLPAVQERNLDQPVEQWRWFDTGDRISQAVVEAGYKLKLLHLDEGREVAVFMHITLSRRIGQWMGARGLVQLFGRKFFWEAYASNLALRRVHNNLFPECEPYQFPFGRDFALQGLMGCAGWVIRNSRYLFRQLRAAQQVEAFVREYEPLGPARAADRDADAVSAGGRRVLKAGEYYHKQKFGPNTVNRGAVLLECEWSGGVFESGVLIGGLFRDGEFRGGTFWGGVFWDGRWTGGRWENGLDRAGGYRPRGDTPPFPLPE